MKQIIFSRRRWPGPVSFYRDEAGATAIEYGLIAALISIVIVAATTTMGTQLVKTFTAVKNGLAGN
ncbi:MAG: Flp family type IVb pilin [Bradyrhizobium sp.]|uniref:Flp family type IVb pilin n=1 Tax=Bradyrhizobium sp. TaxID=376 RepID=UPI001D31D33A|nr:Flp family type IVb pilin [Bradyrhizobium sp.]MBV9563866.1 Flp family type IVb pilin [Bradyrhizobium sp.]